jgi:hypothetical protein
MAIRLTRKTVAQNTTGTILVALFAARAAAPDPGTIMSTLSRSNSGQ